jgi:glutamate formiminotransferase
VALSGAPGPVECVINISEGRNQSVIDSVAAAGGEQLLDVHSDAVHHRSVLTLAGDLADVEAAARRVAIAAVSTIDLTIHRGVHPRLGAVDVVPFVPLVDADGITTAWEAVLAARGAYAEWSGATLGVPCFFYGPERSLPDVRRGAFTSQASDTGPPAPHLTAGASAVGARRVLIAYNIWIEAQPNAGEPGHGHVVAVAKRLAGQLRQPGLRTLGLAVGGAAQVSCNVVDPGLVTLTDVYDAVDAGARAQGCTVAKGELVGLLPRSALASVPESRWAALGLTAEDSIEFRLDTRRG